MVGTGHAVDQAADGAPGGAAAQPPAAARGSVSVPGFWGTELRTQKPDLIGARVVRFLTDDEFPPLHFAGADGQPTGFSVELARAACAFLELNCTVQARRFDTLLESLADRRGDVVAAAIPIRPSLHARFSVTAPYHRTPARFVARREIAEAMPLPTAAALAGQRIAVVRGTAHEAFLATFFPQAEREPVTDLAAGEDGLKAGSVDFLFADGVSLAMWLNGAAAAGCCGFVGGPYLESRFFGEGVGFIVRDDDRALRDALDYALRKLWENGTYAEIYLRHFPVGFY
ncbi:transporter substrate-binding domain-containing protein [Pseudochelatococcus sp. B33]